MSLATSCCGDIMVWITYSTKAASCKKGNMSVGVCLCILLFKWWVSVVCVWVCTMAVDVSCCCWSSGGVLLVAWGKASYLSRLVEGSKSLQKHTGHHIQELKHKKGGMTECQNPCSLEFSNKICSLLRVHQGEQVGEIHSQYVAWAQIMTLHQHGPKNMLY